ncbi:N-acetylglucosaminyl-diphospho-decaprenol L-rhamnosyltransferase [Methylomarinovum tepidoasis]|uniref:N-acetylglucosaminyl-diphospho-decaprenol L-rhamnosyltransferase n=1 Tax=Methylomarinovum tepidoasis TaxID=2840183 RepID=A0AAU9CBC2_9GAMM|nr:N-acetylglucosaminyl-diphospho-decaprenol L-rhamnosyltransferase [Methylomarinovum sp. IN45]
MNYYTDQLLPGLINSLSSQSGTTECIIVDNSRSIHPDSLPNSPLSIRIIKSKNIGYGRAINIALEQSRTKWVLLINPDARLLPGCLENMANATKLLDTPLLGPRFYWDDNCDFRMPPALGDHPSLYASCCMAQQNKLEASLLDSEWQIHHDYFWKQTSPFQEPFLSGACMLVNTDWFQKANEPVFDEDYFLYYEDTDLCLRIMKHDMMPIVVPSAGAVHYFNQAPDSEEKKQDLMEKSRITYYKKHFGSIPRLPKINWLPAKPIPDLDIAGTPPEFPCNFPLNPLTLELAMNPWFVPFIQTDISPPGLRLPNEVWKRLAPGPYFARIRHPQLGTLKKWRFVKPTI